MPMPLGRKLSMILKIVLCLYCFSLQSENISQSVFLSKFEQICADNRLTTAEKTVSLAKYATEQGVSFECVPTYDQPVLQYCLEGTWNLLDVRQHAFYLQLDNRQLAAFDEIDDDPFLVLRTKVGACDSPFDFMQAQANLAHFKIIELGKWPSFSENLYTHSAETVLEDSNKKPDPAVTVLHVLSDLTHPSTVFHLSQGGDDCEVIWWQIASDKNFTLLIPNFNQIQPATDFIEIDPLSETFFNPNQNYYIRVKSFRDETWSSWSSPLAFNVQKPAAVQSVAFDKVDEGRYVISWESDEVATTYWIFGSNALDFVPPLYQVHSDYDPPAYECLQTTQPQIEIDGKFAYYRIIPEKNGRYGVPSEVIRVYDEGLFHTRTLLQSNGETISRQIFPRLLEEYPQEKQPKFVRHSHISNEVWETVTPYLLPDNHPTRRALDRIFSKKRVLKGEASLAKAGFTWTKTGSYSPIFPTRHKKIKGFYIKLYLDPQDRVDWKNWVARAQGAQSIAQAIEDNGYQELFKVPKKYIYPLPAKPAPSGSSGNHRKNFVLLSEDMRIVKRNLNKEMYRYRMTPIHLNAIYKIVSDLGLVDSLFIHNLPWAKDGKLAFVDTEKHHMWPVAFQRYLKYLSPGMQQHWRLLITHQGPNF